MDTQNAIKVKVGQVWTNPKVAGKFTVSRLIPSRDGFYIYCKDSNGVEVWLGSATSDYKPLMGNGWKVEEDSIPDTVRSGASNQPLENNHVCPTCKNKRLNRMEKTCWLCGNPT